MKDVCENRVDTWDQSPMGWSGIKKQCEHRDEDIVVVDVENEAKFQTGFALTGREDIVHTNAAD